MVRRFFRSRVGISERIIGEPVRIGGRTLRPVVQAKCLGGTGGDTAGGGAYARLRLVPESVIVVESDEREFRVPARDRFHLALCVLAGAALLIVVASRSLGRPVR